MKRPSLKSAIEWIAHNDEDSSLDVVAISQQISVVLVSDLYEVPAEKIATQIVKLRELRDRATASLLGR